MNTPSKAWKKGNNHPTNKYVSHYYSRAYTVKNHEVICEFLSYQPIPPTVSEWQHELFIQIPTAISKTRITMDIKLFSYIGKRIDWKRIEDQIHIIIKNNTK